MNEWLVGGLRAAIPLGLAIFAAAYSLPRHRRDEAQKLVPGANLRLTRRYRIGAAICCAVLLLCPALAAGPGCAFLTCPPGSALMADGLEVIGAGVAWALVGLAGDRLLAKPERWALGLFGLATCAVALVEIAAAPLSPDAGDLLTLICAAARLLAAATLGLLLGWGARRSGPQNLMVEPLPPIDPSEDFRVNRKRETDALRCPAWQEWLTYSAVKFSAARVLSVKSCHMDFWAARNRCRLGPSIVQEGRGYFYFIIFCRVASLTIPGNLIFTLILRPP
jgi:hypothetical protein